MSSFENFVTTFTADTSNLRKGAAEAKKVNDDVEKGIKKDADAVDQLGTGLLRFANQFKSLLTAGLTIGAFVTGLRNAAIETQNLVNLSQQTGASVEGIDAWSNAVKQAGGSAEQFQATLVSMNNNLEDIQFNPKNAAIPYFRWLGVNLRNSRGEVKNFLELLPDLAKAFESLSPRQSNALGRKIGLDAGTISLLQKGQKEVDAFIKRQKELGLITKADAEIVSKFNAQWSNTEHAMRSLFVTINGLILPVLTRVAKGLEEGFMLFVRHKDLISGVLLGLATLVSFKLVPALGSLAVALKTVGNAGGIFLVISAIALLYDDLKTFMEGGDSLIGRAIEKWEWLRKVIEAVGLAMFKVNEYIHSRDESNQKLNGIPSNKSLLFGNQADREQYLFGKKPDDGLLNSQVAKNYLGAVDSFPASALTSSVLNNNSSQSSARTVSVNIGDVSIQSQAYDAKGIATDIRTVLQNEIRTAVGNLNDGVVA